MPRHTRTYDLRAVAAEMDEQLDELAADLAEEAAEADDATEREQTVARAQRLEHKLAGVRWAIDEWAPEGDSGPEVTLGALTAGEYAAVRDKTDEAKKTLINASAPETDADGARQIAFAAAGVVEAPFLDEDTPDGVHGLDDRRQAVAELAPQFVTWLEEEIDELSTPEVEAGNFAQRLEAAATTEESSD